MTAPKFFYIPFASGAGATLVPTPDPSQSNGSVSYTDGWGADYQLPLGSSPSAYPLSRGQFNSLMLDITGALQNIQTQGVFSWIGLSPNTPPDYIGNFMYPINALVYYTDGNIYQSLIANNQDTPGATANWSNVSANGMGGVPIGTVIDHANSVPPPNYLALGTASPLTVSRATYPRLLSAITVSLAATTNTSTTVTMASTAGVQIGDIVEGSGVPSSTTVVGITPNVSITLSAATTTSASVTLQFFHWGNGDGSTTFTLPPAARSSTVGAGGSGTGNLGNTVGSVGGVENISLSQANLPNGNLSVNQNVSSFTTSPGSQATNSVTGSSGTPFNTFIQLNPGSQTPLNNYSPAIVMLKCIKYQ